MQYFCQVTQHGTLKENKYTFMNKSRMTDLFGTLNMLDYMVFMFI